MIEAHERELADLRLLQAMQQGDAKGLDELINRYWTALVTYASRLLGDWDRAQDATQEAFVRLWERRAQWATDGRSVRALLYQITRHVALDELKADHTHARLLAVQPADLSSRTPADECEADEVWAMVADAINELPERRREAFLLARLDGLSYRQIATVMGISAQTVANQLSAALAELRLRLGGLLKSPGRDGVGRESSRNQIKSR